ncbi:MAG: phosphoenolpyruvate synthase [uncultured bacterium]|nr:MAG: phosphoenolpyruvate synthase [uncultured bacterium]
MNGYKKEPLVYLWGNTSALINIEAVMNYTVLDDILAAKGELVIYVGDDCYYVTLGKKAILDEKKKYGDMFLGQACFDEHILKMDKLFKWREGLIEEVNSADLSKYSNLNLFELAKKYHEISGRVFGHMVISRPECVDHLSEKLISLLSKQNKNENEVNKQFAVLVSPIELDIIKKEQIARLELLENISEENLKKHVLNFPWLYGYKYTAEDAVSDLKNDLTKDSKESLLQTINSFKTELSKIEKEKNEILKEYSNNEIDLLTERLSFLGHNRLEIKSRFAGLQVTVSPLFKEIAQRGGIELKEMLDNYLLKDLEKLLVNGIKLSEKEITERKRVVFYTKGEEIISIQGEKAEEFAKEYLHEYLNDEKSYVKGMTASRGFAVGKVRKMILNDEIKLDSFEEGEILITEMTAPNMIPIMKRCGGIITNEGGIVSHAAIISREFGIPCIVGTSTATQVFETGDYVELDANKGTARKISEEEFNDTKIN